MPHLVLLQCWTLPLSECIIYISCDADIWSRFLLVGLLIHYEIASNSFNVIGGDCQIDGN